jgi:hypothetical protein
MNRSSRPVTSRAVGWVASAIAAVTIVNAPLSPLAQVSATVPPARSAESHQLVWSLRQRVVAPPSGGVTSVSCPAPNFCVAVDAYGRAVTWNGRAWSQPVQFDQYALPATQDNGTGLFNYYESVSCTSSGSCDAIDELGYAFSWNGHSWAANGRVLSYAKGIDCASSNFCVATGSGWSVWDGSRWSKARPLPDDYADHALAGPSCSSADVCFVTSGVVPGTLLMLSATSYRAVALQGIDAPPVVSCTHSGPTYCLVSPSDAETGWAWTGGGNWSRTSAYPAGALVSSCVSGPVCTMVTVAGNVAVEDNGATEVGKQLFSAQSLGATARFYAGSTLNGVALSCATAGSCVAVTQEGYATVLSGGTWSPVKGADLDTSFTALTCPSPGFCAGGNAAGELVRWDGSWTTQRVFTSGVAALSCSSASFCMAIDLVGDVSLWDGTGWTTAVATPFEGTVDPTLSCASRYFCMVPGSLGGSSFIWDGRTWASAPGIPWFAASRRCRTIGGRTYCSGRSMLLSAVSCPSAEYCVAWSGDDAYSIWGGARWANPVGYDNGTASSASRAQCFSEDSCLAVDDSTMYALKGAILSRVSLPVVINVGTEVACVSLRFCVAVTDADPSTDGPTSITTLTGQPLRVSGSTVLAGFLYDTIGGGFVSCATESFCAAVSDGGGWVATSTG